jgi:uncharacterized membrane protein YhaH (DUF805 family)
MTRFSTALENFVFRGLNFFGEAKRAEYWMILPLIWLAILGLGYLDARQIYGQLLAREIPSLNPLHYAAPMLFLVSLLPRYALTVRRLNDAGRSPKWALLPVKATIMFIVLAIGLASAALTTSSEGAADGTMAAMAIFAIFWQDIGWEVAFFAAQAIQLIELRDVIGMISLPDMSQIAANVSANYGADPATASKVMLLGSALILAPFVMMGIFVLMMLMPTRSSSDSFDSFDSGSSRRPANADKPSKAFASYAILAQLEEERRNPALAASRRGQGREEAKSLYQSRVLGKNTPQ